MTFTCSKHIFFMSNMKFVSLPEQSLGRVEAEDVGVSLELLVLAQLLGGGGPGDAVVRDLALDQSEVSIVSRDRCRAPVGYLDQPHEARGGQLEQLPPHAVGLGVGHDAGAASGLVHQTRNCNYGNSYILAKFGHVGKDT